MNMRRPPGAGDPLETCVAHGEVFAERYQTVKQLGCGGTGQVYLARDMWLERPVALKVLSPHLSMDQAFVDRFRREAKATARLAHPNIVSIYDLGGDGRGCFMVMEYVDGPTLLRYGPLPPVRAARVAAQVADALGLAHQHGLIHRDVKPSNVLIGRSDQVKVTDFGIAGPVGASDDLVPTGWSMGTPTYLSPEQAVGGVVDQRSDIYSLGVVLYEMVTGVPPFAGDSPESIADQHVHCQPPRFSQLRPDLAAGLEAIVMTCLAKAPADRYQSAAEMRADLLRFAFDQETATGSEPTGEGEAVAATPAATIDGHGNGLPRGRYARPRHPHRRRIRTHAAEVGTPSGTTRRAVRSGLLVVLSAIPARAIRARQADSAEPCEKPGTS